MQSFSLPPTAGKYRGGRQGTCFAKNKSLSSTLLSSTASVFWLGGKHDASTNGLAGSFALLSQQHFQGGDYFNTIFRVSATWTGKFIPNETIYTPSLNRFAALYPQWLKDRFLFFMDTKDFKLFISAHKTNLFTNNKQVLPSVPPVWNHVRHGPWCGTWQWDTWPVASMVQRQAGEQCDGLWPDEPFAWRKKYLS